MGKLPIPSISEKYRSSVDLSADLRSFSFKIATTHRLGKLQLASNPEENRFGPSRGHRDAARESKRSSFC